MTKTAYKHIVVNDEGVPMIEDTRVKLILLVGDIKNGWSAEQIHENYPHLPLAVVHSALAYYWDHKEELDEECERRKADADQLLKEMVDPVVMERLRSYKSSG
jgi:uncharacterized protein (DUF433 family)